MIIIIIIIIIIVPALRQRVGPWIAVLSCKVYEIEIWEQANSVTSTEIP